MEDNLLIFGGSTNLKPSVNKLHCLSLIDLHFRTLDFSGYKPKPLHSHLSLDVLGKLIIVTQKKGLTQLTDIYSLDIKEFLQKTINKIKKELNLG